MKTWSQFTALLLASAILALAAPLPAADFTDPKADLNALPAVPPGFRATLFAREPLVRQPCSMVFDARGRLYVGMGPQYRNPKPDTPGDSVVILLDTDGDGRADQTKTFATGFNAVQGLAWRGRDLWVANAPDLTIVRDLDGDDEADEYVLVYTDLGNLEHGLHGLNWAPDGKLYMSKGNSKGLTQPGRIAPRPFRDLWGVTAPPDAPDMPAPKTFRKSEYRHAYHDPADDWGREGGVLRCDAEGKNLEIVSRGFRNPWDIATDSGFNWLGTDNDQTTGDRVFMPFWGGHFGWNHPWSSHWNDEPHPPTAPVSGPLFEGSGTGLVFYDAPQFPPEYRRAFFINDWLRKTTFVWRPEWEGALLRPKGGNWEPFAVGGQALFRPTDMEVGPDGALWILGWSSGYGAEWDNGKLSNQGRVFRLAWKLAAPAEWNLSHRAKKHADWTVAELLADFAGPLPIWRTDAQEELVRRGSKVKAELIAALESGQLSEMQETWTAWTLGRIAPDDAEIAAYFARVLAADAIASMNLRIQALRILSHRIREFGRVTNLPTVAVDMLRSKEPRLRLAAVQAIVQARQKSSVPAFVSLLAEETDRVTYYSAWQGLRELCTVDELRTLLTDARDGVRGGVLLALLESNGLKGDELARLAGASGPGVQEIAALRAGKGFAARSTSKPFASQSLVVSGVSIVRNLETKSSSRYQFIPGGLQADAMIFTDREYPVKEVPPTLLHADYIQTANNDDGSRGEGWLTFEANLPVRVHVGIDTRMAQPPAWIRDSYRREELRIEADHWTMQLYARDYPAGRIELGGNTDDGKSGGKSHYMVVLEPLSIPAPAQPTTLDAALSLVESGDVARGELLFKHRGGAGCVKCHAIGDRKNAFGPDLASIGMRAVARHIGQAIVEPNAHITEGFNALVVEMEDGKTHTGVLLEESGLTLSLGLPTGERLDLDKAKIAERRGSKTSAMPSFAATLSPQHVADLVAFLQTLKGPPTPLPGKPPIAAPVFPATPITPAAAPSEKLVEAREVQVGDWGMSVEPKSSQAIVSYRRKPIATYVWQDRDTLRPYLKTVRTAGGISITRLHPATGEGNDHATMHPGIWLGFGNLNGVDFWRNKGRVVQERFTPVTKEKEPFGFDVHNRYETPDGKLVCRQECRYRFVADAAGYQIVVDCHFTAEQPLVFGVQEEMGLGVRVPLALTVKEGGKIVSDSGGENEKGTWGKVGQWWDYHGTLDGRAAGLMVMAAPTNGETWSHSRDYGVLVANPVRGKPVSIPAGETYRLAFGVLVHERETAAEFDRPAAYQRFLERLKTLDVKRP